MSQKTSSVIDYFSLNGDIIEEANEFDGINLEDWIDKRSSIKPSWTGQYSRQMHFDLPDDTEVSLYLTLNVVYADIVFADGVRTILFKCRQKKNLTRFISRLLELAKLGSKHVHPDFRA